jgi:hypothetical protein
LKGRLVEELGQLLLVEVLVDLALAQRHLGDRAHPGPGGIRTQRSGAITPRRAAWARSKREVWVGKRSATWRAISAPGRGHADEDGPVQARMQALVFSPSAVWASSQITIE